MYCKRTLFLPEIDPRSFSIWFWFSRDGTFASNAYLRHDFVPAPIHAGGLRYHGAGVIVTQLSKDKQIEAGSHDNVEIFYAGGTFVKAEGIIPAPEATPGIATAIAEAGQCKKEGISKTILINLCGHGNFDMKAYQDYFGDNITKHQLSDAEIKASLAKLETPLIK